MKYLALFATALCALGAFPAESGHGTLIAHRGESNDAPENTLPAYKTAVERGFGFECDVYLSKDGRVFTFHDKNLKRTTGGANASRCGDVTWDVISKLDVGSWGKWQGSKFSGTRPALLEEVLELARDGRWIFVEVKPGPEIVPHMKKVFAAQKNATPENVLFIAFNAETCKALKAQMPEYKVFWLTWARHRGGDKRPVSADEIIDTLRRIGADGVNCRYDPKVVTADLVKAIREAGYEFHVWVVDDLENAIEAFKRGVQTVSTNCAGKLLEEYRKRTVADIPALVPMPREITVAEGECVLKKHPKIEVDGRIPPEGYHLSITPDGVTIRHSDAAGLFYAETTLRQLEMRRDGGEVVYPCIEIGDWPAFRWRGVHLDDVRHFFGKGTVKRILDEISRYKFNVFHWHLTDTQAWLLDIPGYPELVKQGKGKEFGEAVGPFYYTANDIREVLAYAAERHVTVVPEVEFPGHFGAALRAYPEFACPGGGKVMCIGNPDAVKFAEDVLDYVCELFPSEVIHIGGDECKRTSWRKCPRCRAMMEREGMADPCELQQWLTKRLSSHLAAKGRSAIGWDEIFDAGASLPAGTMGMCWRPADGAGAEGAGPAYALADAGHEVVMCPYSHCYFDYSQGLDDDPFDYFLKHSRSSTLENVYSFDPLCGVAPDARKFVVGAQCNNWSERTFALPDLEWKLWPRALALAEVLWTYPDPHRRDFAQFASRAEEHRRRLLRDHVNCAGIANRKTEKAAQ